VLVNLHTAVIGVRPPIDLAALGRSAHAADANGARVDERDVWFDGGWHRTPIYARERLPLEQDIEGPAIIEQLDCTTVLEPGCRARLDVHGNLLIKVGEAFR
jgi:N-methylhydantoinase A